MSVPTTLTAIRCPKCAGDLVMYERQGVHVDQCRDCRGIWLDRGELDHLIDAEAAALARRAGPAGGTGLIGPAGGTGLTGAPGSTSRDDGWAGGDGWARGGRDDRPTGREDDRRGGFLGDLLGDLLGG